MTRGALAAIALSLAVACGSGAAPHRRTTPDRADAASEDATALRVANIERRMRRAGLTPGGVRARGFVTSRDSRTLAIRVPARTCLTIIALASRGIRDLDVTLFAPEGDVLAEDVEPDAHPTVQVCAGATARRLYYSLLAYDGSGEYRVFSFAGPRRLFAAAAAIVGGRPGVAASDGRRDGAENRWREFAAGVARRGFQPEGEPARIGLDADQRVRVALPVERGNCYTVAAFATGGTRRVDLRVLDELGAEIARSTDGSSGSTLQLCVDRDGDLAAEVHAVEGAGGAVVGVYSTTVVRAGGPSGLWLGERSPARTSTEDLEGRAVRALERASRRGWRTRSRSVASGRLVPGEAHAHPLTLPANACSLVSVIGTVGLVGIQLRLVDASGALVAEREAAGVVAARSCASAGPRRVEAQIVARLGSGEYQVHVATRAVDAALPGVPEADRGTVLDAVEDLPSGLEPRPQDGALARPYELADAEVSVSLAGAADCALVRAVASGSDGRVSIRVERGDRVRERRAGRVVEVRACASSGDRVALAREAERTDRAWVLVAERGPPPP